MIPNKVALVTGGTRGIGEAIVRDFASKGYDVILNFVRSNDRANKLKEELENKFNVKILPIKADLSKEDEVIHLVEEAYKKFDRIDVLVNNAGIVFDKDFEDRTTDDWRKTLEVNLIAPFLLCKLIGSKMYEQKSGSIVNVSSTNGILGCSPKSIDYDASKAGLINLTFDLATQFAPYIRVNCVSPGWVSTEMNTIIGEEHLREVADRILLKRFAEPMEIAKVVSFLASDDASFVNGENIKVDGGY